MKFIALAVLLSVFFSTEAWSSEQENMKYLSKLLKDVNYDKKVLPRDANGEPVTVTVSAFILDVNTVDDVNMDLNAHFYFRQSWIEPRLSSIQNLVTLQDEDSIWTPDLFFIEEREGSIHQLMFPNKFIKIKPNGEVQYSVKVGVTFNCPMDLRYYPHDTQTCTLNIESYGFQRSHINLKWRKTEGAYEPLGASENITMLDFDLVEVKPSSRNITFQSGDYVTLQIKLTLKRKFGFYAIRLYVPFIILTLMSSFTMWMKAEDRCLRLSLLLVILYLMVSISSEMNRLIPPAPYTKASDVWIGFCESFVFAVFLEFLVVATLARSAKNRKETQANVDLEAKEEILNSDPGKTTLNKLFNAFDVKRGWNGQRNSLPSRIDRMSRIIFPTLFIFFNIIYWIVYATA